MALTTKEFAGRTLDWRWLAAAITAVVIVAAVIMVSRSGEPTDQPGQQAQVPGATQTTGKGSVLPQQPALVRTPTDPLWLTGAPHDISWQRVDGVPLPFSSSDGPAQIRGAVASGYSHTPQGAVMAAAQISFRLAWSPDFTDVVNAQTAVDQQTRQQLIDARSANPLDPELISQYASAPMAFKIADYTDTAASLWLAFPGQGGQFRFARAALTWVDGDWKYSDQFSPMATDLPDSPSLDGFTRI
jgi:hypothetical protein